MLGGASLHDIRKATAGAEHRHHLDSVVRRYPVYDPVGRIDDLPEAPVAYFGNDPSRPWELGKPTNGVNQPRDGEPRVVFGIARDELIDRFEIIRRARRPTDSVHAPKRCLMSSWETAWPASS